MNVALIAGAKVEPFSVFASFMVTFFQTFLQDTGKQNPAIKLFLVLFERRSHKAWKSKAEVLRNLVFILEYYVISPIYI